MKQLLGELYADKEYLQDFINDRDFSNNPNVKVHELVDEALSYLDTRTEFWRQQKPIYARKKDQSKDLAKFINDRNRQLITLKGEDQQRRQAAELEREQNPKTAGGYRPRNTPLPNEDGRSGRTDNHAAYPVSLSPVPYLRVSSQEKAKKSVDVSLEKIKEGKMLRVNQGRLSID